MTRKQITRFLNLLEAKFPVGAWEIDGIKIWPLLRFKISPKLDDFSFDKVRHKIKLFQKITSFFFNIYTSTISLFALVRNWNRIKNSDVIFLTFSHFRTTLRNKSFNKFTDPLIDELQTMKKKPFVLEIATSHEYTKSIHNPLYYINANFLYLISILVKIIAPVVRHKHSLSGYRSFLFFLRKSGINSDQFQIPEIAQEVLIIRNLFLFFSIVLKNSLIKVAFTNAYYHGIGMALNLACSKRNILTVDLQHGSQGEFHMAYGNWNNTPPEGYSLLPQAFWCWSEHEAKAILKWFSQTNRVLVGGNPFIDFWQSHSLNTRDLNKQIKEIKEKNKVHILFTLQQSLADLPPSWFWKIVKNSPPNWKWWFRLHPKNLINIKDLYPLLSDLPSHKYEIEIPSRLPLLALLLHTDVHVTQFSTVVIEAAHFGIPSIVLTQNGLDLYAHETKIGMCMFANSRNFALILTLQLEKRNPVSRLRTPILSQTLDRLFKIHP